ncbi:hypothetical protein J2T15_003275 [Paenibacillus harenae]|uniref:Uncharacterized protein n=1 Tax=Paenibacillus harenae TaxID=306543 RepID=A0ABT9U3M3_PAEHA|nr:hypothetical protein [Paenibacillus harenae]
MLMQYKFLTLKRKRSMYSTPRHFGINLTGNDCSIADRGLGWLYLHELMDEEVEYIYRIKRKWKIIITLISSLIIFGNNGPSACLKPETQTTPNTTPIKVNIIS